MHSSVGRSSSRSSAVLAPQFVAGLPGLGVAELRRRRDEALAEREFQSYLRRLLQVRKDVVANEWARRRAGRAVPTLVDRLTAVLSEGPQGRGRGEAPRFALPVRDVEEAERRAESVVAESRLACPETLSEAEVRELLAQLDEAERAVSVARAAVIRVHDALQEELKRRYRADLTLIAREQ